MDGLAASVALLARSVAADLRSPLTEYRVDGGLTRSRTLLQAQADLLQVQVEVCPEVAGVATALGVAALARLGVGAAHSLAEAVGPADVQAVVQPRMSADEAAHRLSAYETALASILGTGPC